MKRLYFSFIFLAYFPALFSMDNNNSLEKNVSNLVDSLTIVHGTLTKFDVSSLLQEISESQQNFSDFLQVLHTIITTPGITNRQKKLSDTFNTFAEIGEELGKQYKKLSYQLGIDFIQLSDTTFPPPILKLIKTNKKEVQEAIDFYVESLTKLGNDITNELEKLVLLTPATNITFTYKGTSSESTTPQNLIDHLQNFIRGNDGLQARAIVLFLEFDPKTKKYTSVKGTSDAFRLIKRYQEILKKY